MKPFKGLFFASEQRFLGRQDCAPFHDDELLTPKKINPFAIGCPFLEEPDLPPIVFRHKSTIPLWIDHVVTPLNIS